jgi:hypothetical protein
MAEADDVEGHRRGPLQLRRGLDQPGQVARLFHVLPHQAPQLARAVLLERHPRLERAEAARELDPQVAELVEPRGHAAAGGLQVRGGGHHERVVMGPRVAHEHAPRLDRQVAPLVQVEPQRVRPLDARHQRRQLGGQAGQRAERAVHVEPEAFARADVGQRREVVDGAGVDRARVAHHGERVAAGRTVGRDPCF